MAASPEPAIGSKRAPLSVPSLGPLRKARTTWYSRSSLKEKLWGTGSGNLTELEGVLNRQAALGYTLHTITTAASGSKGLGGGDRIQPTMVFEKIG